MDVVSFTEYLVKSLASEPDMVKVEKFETDEEGTILEVIVSNNDKGAILGKNGSTISAIKTLVLAKCYLNNEAKVKINVDSF